MLRPHAACRAARDGAGGAKRNAVLPRAAPHARPALPPCRAQRNGASADDASASGVDVASGGAAGADGPQSQPPPLSAAPLSPRLRDSQLRRGGVICTSGVVLGTQRNRAAKGIRAGGVVYVEADDGTLEALTANDVRGSLEKMVRCSCDAAAAWLCACVAPSPARRAPRMGASPAAARASERLIVARVCACARVCAAERHQQPAAARGRRRRRVAGLLVRAPAAPRTRHARATLRSLLGARSLNTRHATRAGRSPSSTSSAPSSPAAAPCWARARCCAPSAWAARPPRWAPRR
jgi:hypothetical protein